jgi:L-malate glycosyltransferase
VSRSRKRILVLCPFPQGVAAGQRLKYEQYFDDWRSRGYDISVSSFMDMAMWRRVYEPGHMVVKIWGTLKGYLRRFGDLFRIRRYDIVYVFMWVTPLGTSLIERIVRALARRLIFDVEDNVLVGQGLDRHPNAIIRFIKGKSKARFLIRTADHVITSSPFLNDICLETSRKRACTYISSSVDTNRFVPPVPAAPDCAPVTIGWTGTFSTKVYLDLLRPVFAELARRARFRLRVIGNFEYELPGVDLEVLRWSKASEVEDMQGIDIGVYPLPIDDWVMGKSGLKAIQYMAFGKAIVATDVGTTPLLIRDGENGLLVRTEEEWIDALEKLIHDPALRARLGEAARRDAVAKYSTKAVAADYRRVLESVAEGL